MRQVVCEADTCTLQDPTYIQKGGGGSAMYAGSSGVGAEESSYLIPFKTLKSIEDKLDKIKLVSKRPKLAVKRRKPVKKPLKKIQIGKGRSIKKKQFSTKKVVKKTAPKKRKCATKR
jgi:hypothetical protein